MWQGWLGIAVTYVILVSVSMFLITNPRIKLIIKICLIPIIIWFSVALYYSANSLKGHPIEGFPPHGSYIVGVHIVENSQSSDASIFLTIVLPKGSTLKVMRHPIDPTMAYIYFKEGEPILYKLPYDRDMHGELMEAMKMADLTGGQLRYGKTGKQKAGDYLPGDRGFSILNPFDVLKKEGAE